MRTDTELVLEEPRCGWRIQRETGFPSEVWYAKGDVRRTFELESLELEAPGDTDLFQLLELERGAADESEATERMFAEQATRRARWTCLNRIDRALAAGDVDWHETTPDGAVTLEPVFCLGLCAQAPAAMLDGELHARLDEDCLTDILAELRS